MQLKKLNMNFINKFISKQHLKIWFEISLTNLNFNPIE